jgi:DNA-binding transcriptional regulator YdaS (Cro superfamily)
MCGDNPQLATQQSMSRRKMMIESEENKIRSAVERVAKIATNGNMRRLCALLDVSTQALYKWIADGVPVKRALQMSMLTKGEVQWHELCPHVADELRQSLEAAAKA